MEVIQEVIQPPVKYRAFRRFSKNIGALFSVVYLAVLFVVCFIPETISKYPQDDQVLGRARLPPSSDHWFGTDKLGRDVLTEILHGGQVSLKIALVVAIVSTFIGATLGAVAGIEGGWLDSFLMRTTDLFLVVPQIVILALALNKYGESGEYVIGFIVALTFWMSTARYVRGQVLSIRNLEYIDAAKIAGHKTIYIVFRHLIPNSWNIIAVSSAIAVANAILIESTLSFLGFGTLRPDSSWGLLLDEAKELSSTKYFYLFFFPGMAIFLTVLAFNFIGDGLRDALDPRSEQ